MATIWRNLEIMAAVRRINTNLLAVTDKVADAVESTMLTQAALIATEIKSLAPVDEAAENPGALKQSVRIERGKTDRKKAFVILIKAGGPLTRHHVDKGKAGFAYDYDYARAVEFGTQEAPAHPFFWPIWRLRRKGARAAIRKAAVIAVKDVFK